MNVEIYLHFSMLLHEVVLCLGRTLLKLLSVFKFTSRRLRCANVVRYENAGSLEISVVYRKQDLMHTQRTNEALQWMLWPAR